MVARYSSASVSMLALSLRPEIHAAQRRVGARGAIAVMVGQHV